MLLLCGPGVHVLLMGYYSACMHAHGWMNGIPSSLSHLRHRGCCRVERMGVFSTKRPAAPSLLAMGGAVAAAQVTPRRQTASAAGPPHTHTPAAWG